MYAGAGWKPAPPKEEKGMSMRGPMNMTIGMLMSAMVLAVGCQRDRTASPGSAGVDPLPTDLYPRVEVAGGLSPYIVISGAEVAASTDSRPMSVVSAVRSTWDKNVLNVQYRYFFFDEHHVPMNADPDWHFAKLPPRSRVFLEGAAMDTGAREWRLQIRPAQ